MFPCPQWEPAQPLQNQASPCKHPQPACLSQGSNICVAYIYTELNSANNLNEFESGFISKSLQKRMQPCRHFWLCRSQIRKPAKPIGSLQNCEIIISVLLRCCFDSLLQQQQKTNTRVKAWTLIEKLLQNSKERCWCGWGNSMRIIGEKWSDSVYILKVEPEQFADVLYD